MVEEQRLTGRNRSHVATAAEDWDFVPRGAGNVVEVVDPGGSAGSQLQAALPIVEQPSHETLPLAQLRDLGRSNIGVATDLLTPGVREAQHDGACMGRALRIGICKYGQAKGLVPVLHPTTQACPHLVDDLGERRKGVTRVGALEF